MFSSVRCVVNQKIPTLIREFAAGLGLQSIATSSRMSRRTRHYVLSLCKRGRKAGSRAKSITAFGGRNTGKTAAQTLQFSHGAGVHRLGAALHTGQREAPSAGYGCGGSRVLPIRSRGARTGIRQHPEPGAFGAVVPLQGGAWDRSAVDGERGPREATEA